MKQDLFFGKEKLKTGNNGRIWSRLSFYEEPFKKSINKKIKKIKDPKSANQSEFNAVATISSSAEPDSPSSIDLDASQCTDDVIDIQEMYYEDQLLYSDNDDNKESETYFSAFSSRKKDNSHGWVIDSGASVHMSFDISYFHDIKYGDQGSVTIANGSSLRIEGRGTAILSITNSPNPLVMRLENVAFIPKLDCKLISVRALDKQNLSVTFTNGSAYLLSGSKKVKFGDFVDHSYFLLQHKERAAPCIHEWHKRIGHRNLKDIKRASTRLGLKITRCVCNDECDSCIRAKQADKSFPKCSEKPVP